MTRDGTAVVAATLTYRHLRTALTIALAVGVQPCAWSLDDARIVFGASTADGKSSVYITTPEGADFEELTAHDPSASFPAWSHNGRAIAFSYSPVGLGISIHLMDPDGRNVRRISVPLGPAHLDWEATWSPRDDAIAFTSARMGHDRMGIYLVDVDGGPERRLTGTNTWSRRANWRPIGDTMAYQSSSTGSMDIHIMDGQGGDLGQLTDRPRHEGAPSWHPRTKAIAFESWDDDLHGFTASSALLFRRHASSAAAGSGRYLVASRVAPVSMNSCRPVLVQEVGSQHRVEHVLGAEVDSVAFQNREVVLGVVEHQALAVQHPRERGPVDAVAGEPERAAGLAPERNAFEPRGVGVRRVRLRVDSERAVAVKRSQVAQLTVARLLSHGRPPRRPVG